MTSWSNGSYVKPVGYWGLFGLSDFVALLSNWVRDTGPVPLLCFHRRCFITDYKITGTRPLSPHLTQTLRSLRRTGGHSEGSARNRGGRCHPRCAPCACTG